MHRPGLAWPHSSAIFWFSTGVLWKSGKPSGFHMVKRSDYITNSVRCQGTVIFLNKMKGESGRPEPVEKLAQSLLFFMSKWTNIGLNIKPLNFMKIDFTDAELETIAAAMDDYMCYADDEFASADDLIGGIPVRDRVTSICRKIDEVYDN